MLLTYAGHRTKSCELFSISSAAGLPLPYKYESLLAETLFAQMLRVPAPAHKPVAYGALMVDLCKLLPTFPRSMSACVRESFARWVILFLNLLMNEFSSEHKHSDANGALTVDLCELLPTFPRSMSACVRKSFARSVPVYAMPASSEAGTMW